MRAAQINKYGDISDITLRQIEKPKLTENQLLVQVTAAALNPFDYIVIRGGVMPVEKTNFPLTVGQDFAGVVEEIGTKVKGFTIGDRVFGSSNALFEGSGAMAECLVVKSSSAAIIPENVSDEEAASLPTAGIAALTALETLSLKSGQTIFIDGASGGVGSYAVQIAKSKELVVIALASAGNTAYVKSLGADKVIDYNSDNYLSKLGEIDALFHTVRTLDGNEMLGILKQGGAAVSLIGDLDIAHAEASGLHITEQQAGITTEKLEKLVGLVSDGSVTVHISKRFPLDKTRKAYDALKSRTIAGKVVILP